MDNWLFTVLIQNRVLLTYHKSGPQQVLEFVKNDDITSRSNDRMTLIHKSDQKSVNILITCLITPV